MVYSTGNDRQSSNLTLEIRIVLDVLIQHESVHKPVFLTLTDILHEVFKSDLLVIELRLQKMDRLLTSLDAHYLVQNLLGYLVSWGHQVGKVTDLQLITVTHEI